MVYLNNNDHFVFQSPASSAPFLYLQPSEVIYQPVEIAQDGGCVPPPLSLMEASVPEVHVCPLCFSSAQGQEFNPRSYRSQENAQQLSFHSQLRGKVIGYNYLVNIQTFFNLLKLIIKTVFSDLFISTIFILRVFLYPRTFQ